MLRGDKMREPGIEPGSRPWQGRVLPLNHSRLKVFRMVILKGLSF